MRRLAYFSPLPPAPSGIADYSLELLPYLIDRADVTVYYDGLLDKSISTLCRCRELRGYPADRWHYEAALFHMGNSIWHAAVYEMFRRFPGILVLHDTVLHHFVADYTAGGGDFAAYARELAYERGRAGSALALAIQFGEREHPLFELPLTRRLLDLSLGIVVHSQTAAATVREQTRRSVGVVPALIEPLEGRSRRAVLNLPEDTVLFGSFGHVTAARRLDLVLTAFRAILSQQRCHFLVVGDCHPEVDLPRLVADLGLEEHVTLLGRAPTLADFVDWLESVDAVVNLRQPSAGETSAAALRALAAGKPLITSAAGWYGELPANVALKVSDATPAALTDALGALAGNPALRSEMGAAAAAYARQAHSGARAADAYLAFVEQVLESARD